MELEKKEASSTDLLKQMLKDKEGEKKETFKSKLTDTDTLTRFAAGLYAAISGDVGTGAAIAGSGLINAAKEAEWDNEDNENEIEDLKLKMSDNAFQREGQMIAAGLANPELVANMEDFASYVGNPELGESIYNSAVNMKAAKAGKERANFILANLPNMTDPEQRKIAVRDAAQSSGYHLSDEMVEEIAKNGLSPQTLLSIGATATPASMQDAWSWWVSNPDDPDRDQKYIDMLYPMNPPRGNRSESDLKFEMILQRNAILSKLYDPVTLTVHSSAWGAYNSTEVLTAAERAFLAGDKDFDPERLKDTGQQLFDMGEYNTLLKYAKDAATQHNIMAGARGETDLIIKDVDAYAQGFALNALTAAEQAVYGMKIDRTDAVMGFAVGAIKQSLGYPLDYQDSTGMIRQMANQEIIAAANEIRKDNPDMEGDQMVNEIYEYIANKYRSPMLPVPVVKPALPETVAADQDVKPSSTGNTSKVIGSMEDVAGDVGGAIMKAVSAPKDIYNMLKK